jgi:hypothetical protein
MRRSEEARVSEEAVRRKGGGGAGRSEKAKVPEDGGLINQAFIGRVDQFMLNHSTRT